MPPYCCPCPVTVSRDEQLFVKKFSKCYVVNGPTTFIAPIGATIKRRQPITLDSTQYMIVRNIYTGETSRIVGPCMHFLTEEEEKVQVKGGQKLSQTQYCRVQNTETGTIRQVIGPALCIPSHCETIISTENAIKLSPTDYLHVRNVSTGKLSTVRGPSLFVPSADEEVVKQLQAIALKDNEYVRISDKASGGVRVEKGESLVFLSPTEERLGRGEAAKGVNVDANQAALLRDLRTGQLELITSPQVLVPQAHQELVEVRKKIRLEEYHTAVVKDNRGTFRHIPAAPAPQSPSPLKENGNGNGTAGRCRGSQLQSYGSRGSHVKFIKGPTSFFLEPYTELLEQRWSSGLHKDQRNLVVKLFDSRPHFMWYEFDARTKDNVELMLGVTLFWGLSDVQRLVATTSDAAGDVCSHVRSMIIQAVSQMTLEDFLASFNSVVQQAVFSPQMPTAMAAAAGMAAAAARAPAAAATTADTTTTMAVTDVAAAGKGPDPFGPLMERALSGTREQKHAMESGAGSGSGPGSDGGVRRCGWNDESEGKDDEDDVEDEYVVDASTVDPFYSDRGINIQEIEVRSISCKDPETQRVLQEIIKENTNRISRLQQQESANEVNVKKMQGDITKEKMRKDLLEIQQRSAKMEGATIGEQESSRIRSFMEGLQEVVPDDNAKIQLFNTLRKGEALKALSGGSGVSMYFTPNDIDLKIAA